MGAMSFSEGECSYNAIEAEVDGDNLLEQFHVSLSSKFEKAVKLLQEATKLYRSEKAWEKAAKAYRTLASCRLRLHQTYEVAVAYFNTAGCYEMIGYERKIEKYLEKAAPLYLECDDPLTTAKIYRKLTHYCERRNCMVKALEYSHKAAQLFLSDSRYFEAGMNCSLRAASFANDCSRTIELYKVMASSYLHVNNFSKAASCYVSIAKLLEEKQDEDTTTVQENYEVASRMMMLSKDPIKGYQWMVKVACLAVQSKQYSEAIEQFECAATLYVKIGRRKLQARKCLLYALLCAFCKGDLHVDLSKLLTLYEGFIYPSLESTQEWLSFKELASTVIQYQSDMRKLLEVIRALSAEKGLRGYKIDGIKDLLLHRILEKKYEKQRFTGMIACKFSDMWGINYDRDDGCGIMDLRSLLEKFAQKPNVLHLRSRNMRSRWRQYEQEASESSTTKRRIVIQDEDSNQTDLSFLRVLKLLAAIVDVEGSPEKRRKH